MYARDSQQQFSNVRQALLDACVLMTVWSACTHGNTEHRVRTHSNMDHLVRTSGCCATVQRSAPVRVPRPYISVCTS